MMHTYKLKVEEHTGTDVYLEVHCALCCPLVLIVMVFLGGVKHFSTQVGSGA